MLRRNGCNTSVMIAMVCSGTPSLATIVTFVMSFFFFFFVWESDFYPVRVLGGNVLAL